MRFSSITIIFAILITQSITHVAENNCVLECYCDNGGNFNVPCVNNRCTARVPPEQCNTTKPVCFIGTTLSTQPYITVRFCSFTNVKMENYLMDSNAVVVWLLEKRLSVYHKCEKKLCNKNYTAVKMPKLLKKIRDQLDECLPATKRRMEEVLTVRRNFSDPIECFCDIGNQCKNNRCSSVEENEETKLGFVCQTVSTGGGQCQKATGQLQAYTRDYAASIATKYLETIYLAGCRHRDLCNSNVQKGSKVSVRNLFCQWICPKLSLKKLQVKWWIALISLIVGMVVFSSVACFLSGRYRLTVRLQV